MATLEKIRSRQKLLFTIIIIALGLFIVSIADANSIRNMFGPGTTIAEVGKHKIDYQDYNQRIEELQTQLQAYQQQMDRDELSQIAIKQLMGEALLQEQVEKLGLKVSDKEISEAMMGAYPPQEVYQFIQMASQRLGLPQVPGRTAGAVLFEAIVDPTRYGLTADQVNSVAIRDFRQPTMADAWAKCEDMVEKNIQQQTLRTMVSGLFTANMLDAQSIYDDNSNNMIVSYVTAPYASVPDDGIEVTDSDIRSKYDEYKPSFKLAEETRLVDYIAVPIVPSPADLQAADLEADRLTEALRSQPGLEGSSVSGKFVHDSHTVLVSDMKRDQNLSHIPDSLIGKEKVYRYPRERYTYRIAKVMDVKPQVDSINISMYIASTPAEADSIKALIAGGATFASIAEAHPQQSVADLWQSLIGAPADLAAMFENAVVGQTFVDIDSIKGTNAVYCVNERKAPKQVADIVLFTYEVDPSNATITDIKTQLSSFLASNSKGEAFSANADSLYRLQHYAVSASTPRLGYTGRARRGMPDGIADSRHAVQWAMNAKKGDVSPILEDNRDYYVVVALKDIYSDGYTPYTAPMVNDDIRARAMADKKGDKLIEQYQGKAQDLNGYAALMGAEVRTDSAVVFTSPRFLTLGSRESTLQGQVAGAQKGTLVGPVKGNNEVIVFVVNDVNAKGRPFDYASDSQNFMRSFGSFASMNSDPYPLLKGSRTEKNNTLKFENYEK